MSNFEFLRVYWPSLTEIGKSAEIYVYTDPNTCIYKLGQMSEIIVREICVLEKIIIQPGSTHQSNINLLRRHGLISKQIDDILFAIRKARNAAVHSGIQSQEQAMTLLEMTHSLATWFMEIYGDWSYNREKFIKPKEDKSEYEKLKKQLEAQDTLIEDLVKKIESVETAASTISYDEKIEKVSNVESELVLEEDVQEYLDVSKIRVDISIFPSVNFALQQNGINLIRNLSIINNTEEDLEDVVLSLKTKPNFLNDIEYKIKKIPSQSDIEIRDIYLKANPSILAELTERLDGLVYLSLEQDNKILYEEQLEVSALAYDQWQGINFMPEVLVSYITPNHPDINKILTKASDILKDWKLDSQLEGYQSKSITRVKDQISAIFAAIKSLDLVYTNPPASFEHIGQRIRMSDQVIADRIGTCLDLTLLYASAIEAIGLNPILITQPGHIFLGCWLEELTFPEIIEEDPTMLSKRAASGVNELVLIESTFLTSNSNAGFDEAVTQALINLEKDNIEYIIDVKRARLTNMRPLPSRIKTKDGISIIEDERSYDAKPKKSGLTLEKFEEEHYDKKEATKIGQWERRLLDLSLRNNLINMRMTRSMIPVLSHSLDDLEDAIASGRVFNIHPKPLEWHIRQEDLNFNNSNDLGTFKKMIQKEMGSRRLRTFLPEIDLENRLKNLYRTARLAFEENGANTLYMTFGIMKWYETSKSDTPRYAPIILVPVELRRRAASHSYTIRIRDEESQMNITLLEKIKQDFGIEINGLDPLPMDDDGVDIRKVFTIIRKNIKNQSRWDLIESSFIGIFSFSQFVMWNDLRNRREDLEKNKIVKSLIQGNLTWNPEYSKDFSYENIENSVLQPLPADASQLTAIQNSVEGRSFVLHGPPGTGKSQTITSLIANNLFHGKTVLFVAEKMAALEVVQKRLTDIGLGDFCLELHSNKANKKDILEYFDKVTSLNQYRPTKPYEKKLKEISILRKELNQYVLALHKTHTNGFTIYKLISEHEKYKNAPKIKNFRKKDLNKITQDTKYNHEQFLNQLVSIARQTGHPHAHPLSFIELSEYTQSLKDNVIETSEDFETAITNFTEIKDEVINILDFELDNSITGLETLRDLLSNLEPWKDFPQHWQREDNLNFKLNNIKKLANETLERDEQYKILREDWNQDFYSFDGFQLSNEINVAQTQWFLPKYFAMSKIKKKLSLMYKHEKLSDEFVIASGEKLKKYQQQEKLVNELFASHGSYLRDDFKDLETDWENIISKANQAIKSSDKLKELSLSHDFRIKNANKHEIYPLIPDYINKYNDLKNQYDKFAALLKVKEFKDADWIQKHRDFLNKLDMNMNSLKEWVLWNEMKEKAIEMNLDNVISSYEQGAKHEDVLPMYKKKITHQLSSMMIDKVEILNKFNGAMFNAKIKTFIEMEQTLAKLSQLELSYKLKNNIPDFSLAPIGKSEIAILKRAIASKGRGMTIRRLFSEIPNILPKLAPCMLMSPISAAQYLDPSQTLFDLVVFDEASQLPTAKAIGTIARGENTIIVGDPKQMPPTSFFAANKVDEDNIELEDLESILDDAIAIAMPEEHLQWHYRSKHESLISFSNNQFYENKLNTFPSFNDIESKVSLKYVRGTFDRGRRRHNEIEAKAVVEELFRRYNDPELNKFSVGVVTFNSNQQNLIEDLIIQKSVEYPEFDTWINDSEEPIFIKNLENVQGDERDIILFSIGYGPDQEGKVYMNFGPLNREGGWRRLNVAITRSRHEMIVFSSLYPEDIDLNRTSADGVANLKHFLEYAINNSKLNIISDDSLMLIEEDKTDGIAQSIAQLLTDKGYEVQLDVGKSSFKVDVAIVDKNDEKKYILGILLDGKSYRKAKTTRDREVSHTSILRMLGWNIHRVWSMDWRENPNRELEIIENLISELENGFIPEDIKETKVKPDIKLRKINNKKTYEAPPYKSFDAKIKKVNSDDFVNDSKLQREKRSRLRRIVTVESPIYKDIAFRKLINSYGITRMGQRIQKDLEDALSQTSIYVTKELGREVLWQDKSFTNRKRLFRSNTNSVTRSAKDVPLKEVSSTMIYVLENYISLNHEDLVRESANLLGINTITQLVRTHFDEAIKIVLKEKKIILSKDETYVLPEKG